MDIISEATQPSLLKKWGTLIVLSLALAIIIIDTTLLNVSLSAIIRDLHTDIQHIQWVITAYALMLAALTITGGRLGDFFGRKRMFVVGAIIFAAGSFLASVSPSVGILILGESIIEGIGAVLMLPATASLLVANYKGRDRAVAFGIWGGIAAAASAIGPLIGGYLTTNFSWRWGFRINVVIAAILVFGAMFIHESRDTEEKPSLDWLGVIFSSLALFFVSFGIIEASSYGWWFAKATFVIGSTPIILPWNLSISVLAILLGLAFIPLFLLLEAQMERIGKTPLVSLALFKNTRFSAGVLTTAVMSLGWAGIIFSLPVFFQSVQGLDAFHTGLALLPMSLSSLVASPLSAFLAKKIYPKTLVIAGLAMNILAYIVLFFSLSPASTPLHLAPGLLLYGFGMGLIMAQINNITLSAVSPQEAGEASGVNNAARQLGATLGSAVIGSILLTSILSGLTTGIAQSSIIPEQYKTQLIRTLPSQISNIEFGGKAALAQEIPASVQTEILRIGHEATAKGNKNAFLFAPIFSFLALLIAMFRLPKERNVEYEASARANDTK